MPLIKLTAIQSAKSSGTVSSGDSIGKDGTKELPLLVNTDWIIAVRPTKDFTEVHLDAKVRVATWSENVWMPNDCLRIEGTTVMRVRQSLDEIYKLANKLK